MPSKVNRPARQFHVSNKSTLLANVELKVKATLIVTCEIATRVLFHWSCSAPNQNQAKSYHQAHIPQSSSLTWVPQPQIQMSHHRPPSSSSSANHQSDSCVFARRHHLFVTLVVYNVAHNSRRARASTKSSSTTLEVDAVPALRLDRCEVRAKPPHLDLEARGGELTHQAKLSHRQQTQFQDRRACL